MSRSVDDEAKQLKNIHEEEENTHTQIIKMNDGTLKGDKK